jgi:hypothetical protein
VVAGLIAQQFAMPVTRASIGADWTSLNSVNGTVETADGERYFFKFHQEKAKRRPVREYYRAEILQRAGLPVDVPLRVSREPGHQVLLYAFRHDRRLADVCLEIDRDGGDARIRAIGACSPISIAASVRAISRRCTPRMPRNRRRGDSSALSSSIADTVRAKATRRTRRTLLRGSGRADPGRRPWAGTNSRRFAGVSTASSTVTPSARCSRSRSFASIRRR